MAAFEFGNNTQGQVLSAPEELCADSGRRGRDDCIIALKVYDSCRQQDCLTGDELGPARAAESACIGDECYNEGEVIDPPANAAAVTIDRLRVSKIIIVDKEPNSFKKGFWDIDLKYVFEYRLSFREADGSLIGRIRSNSIYNKKLCLFGSTGSDIVIASDLFGDMSDGSTTLDSDPYTLVEAKAVALSAELKYQRRRSVGGEDFSPTPNEVEVTLGLFSIVKLFRIVNIEVASKGFCIPPECEQPSTFSPCDFFDHLDFPMDIFAPPERGDFLAGVSGNIPRIGFDDADGNPCGCSD